MDVEKKIDGYERRPFSIKHVQNENVQINYNPGIASVIDGPSNRANPTEISRQVLGKRR